MRKNTNINTAEKPKTDHRFIKTLTAFAWLVVAASQALGSYVILLNFQGPITTAVGVFQGVLAVGLVGYHFIRAYHG